MKTLLVPVDFSESAYKALDYAIALASKTDSRVVVGHVYSAHVLPGIVGSSREKARGEVEKEFDDFMARVDAGTVQLETAMRQGDTVKEIVRMIEDFEPSLVVMATAGGNTFMRRAFGTTSETIAKRGICPVLVIPEDAPVKPIKNIVYAADFENGDELAMMQLLQVQDLHQASLTFLHIKSDKQPDYIDDDYIKSNLVKNFPNAEFAFEEIAHDDVAEGITNYVKANNTDLLAFTILDRQIYERVMYGSVTSDLLQKLKLPMLALPESGTMLDFGRPVSERNI